MIENRKIILVANHIETNIKQLTSLLDDKYDLVFSTSGLNTLQIVKEKKANLILLDIMLPILNGFEVCKILKENKTTRDIPVIFLTSNNDEESIEQIYDVGGIDYITKPFRSIEVLSRIKTHLCLQQSRDKLKYTIENKTILINELLSIGISLTSENNFEQLMEKIMLGTKHFSKADAGTIYLMSEDKKTLEFSVVHTDKLNIKMGGTGEKLKWPPLPLYKDDGTHNDSMVAVKCALESKQFNFSDVYNVDEFNFEGTKVFDKSTTYRTKSMLVVPMLNREGEVIGVLQLINKLNKENKIVSFNTSDEILISSMSSLGGVTINNHILVKNLRELLDSLELKVTQRTAALEEAKKEIEVIYKHTRESIDYASLIQSALIPDESILGRYFKDYFVHWVPKDTVGGDIWLFDELRHDDECLLFFIDCTGHGVPGAFVTMIVKAIEREIIVKITEDKDMVVSPAWIMSYFNKTMKELLKQDSKDSLSNAGWDGGIIYFNKKDKILKFAGAETSLFYLDTDGTFNIVKGNRYSVGYKKCDMNYPYKETVIDIKDGMKFYCTTDGYLDQNGGTKDFPFGKKRFEKQITENSKHNMLKQKEIYISNMEAYESMINNNDRNDDITVIGLEV